MLLTIKQLTIKKEMGTKYIDRVKELCSHVSFYIEQMLLIMKSIVQNYRFEEISMKHRFPSSLYFTIEFRVYDKLHSNDIFHYRLLHGCFILRQFYLKKFLCHIHTC